MIDAVECSWGINKCMSSSITTAAPMRLCTAGPRDVLLHSHRALHNSPLRPVAFSVTVFPVCLQDAMHKLAETPLKVATESITTRCGGNRDTEQLTTSIHYALSIL